MVFITELGLAACSSVLLVNALLPGPKLWLLFVVEAISAALVGFLRPSLDALTPRLRREGRAGRCERARSLRFQIGLIGGPVVGGVLIATIGLAACSGSTSRTYLVSLTALSMMRTVPPPADAPRPSLKSIAEGFRYARSRPELLGTYGVDIVAMFFGMPHALCIRSGHQLFGGPGRARAAVHGAVGRLVRRDCDQRLDERVHRHGLAVIVAASVWGVGVLLLGLAPNLPLALAALVLAGAADMVSGIFR